MMPDPRDATVALAERRIGQTLRGKYVLEKLLGCGGMAAVYAATHRNGKRVAVKVLNPALSVMPDIRARFLREGYVANKVDHPGALSVIDDDEAEDGCVFLVMELLDGDTLEGIADRHGGRLELPVVLAMTDQVLDVLAHAHAHGIVHRDLKPANLFLTTAGVVKVLDFGIARLKEMSQGAADTSTGVPMGTPAFMAPEQARGHWHVVDGRTDLWALGATMFKLLSGRDVHAATTVSELLVFAVTQPAPPLRSVFAAPDDIAHIVDAALAYEMARRWPDARSMQAAVRAALAARGGAPSLATGSAGSAPANAPSPSHAAVIAAAASNPRIAPPHPVEHQATGRAFTHGTTGIPLGTERRRASGRLATVLVTLLGLAALAGIGILGLKMMSGAKSAGAASSSETSSSAAAPTPPEPPPPAEMAPAEPRDSSSAGLGNGQGAPSSTAPASSPSPATAVHTASAAPPTKGQPTPPRRGSPPPPATNRVDDLLNRQK
jgi:serine/threonine-protein kinase